MGRGIVDIFGSKLAFEILANCTEETSPTKIAKKVNKSKHVVSKYLNELAKNKLVNSRKIGKNRLYIVNKDVLTKYWMERNLLYEEGYKELLGRKASRGKKITNKEQVKLKDHIKDIKNIKKMIKELAKDELFKDFLIECLKIFRSESSYLLDFLVGDFYSRLLYVKKINDEQFNNKEIKVLIRKLTMLEKMHKYELLWTGYDLDAVFCILNRKLNERLK